MRAEIKIFLFEDDYDELIIGEITIDEFLVKVFEGVDVDTEPSLQSGLLTYHSDNGGAPEISNWEIVDVSFNPATLSGSFDCNYTVGFFYTCSDLDTSKFSNLKWDFFIDKDNSELKLVGEDVPERDPDEY